MMMETIPPGTILRARYHIKRALGSGGFGHVYQAIDINTHQQCAIKEYLVSGSSGQAQLQHEARVLSVLHHPNLPMFLDAFSERGHYYIVLSYIDGSDLTDYIRHARQHNEAIPLHRVMSWLIATCDAVQFLHSQQPPVIHRDIKPDNIRITPDGTVVLVDLGNAKAIADGARTLFFARHQGTPGYAPPEQYPGGTGTDARSDVYALGGTLYFALTTHEPPSVSTRNQALQQHLPDLPTLQELLASNPPELSEDANAARQFRLGVSKPAKPAPRHLRHLALLGTLSPELLERLNNIIKRAMALKPGDRYQSIADLDRDLRRVLEALPVETPSAPVATPHRKDPHGTEPDLPMLYETLQAAKERAQQQTSEPVPAQPPAAPASTSSIRCPRCGATPVRQAVFCAQCGASLTPTPGSDNRKQTSSTQKHASEQDFSAHAAPRATPPAQATDSRARNRATPPAQIQQASIQAPSHSSGSYLSQASAHKPPQFMHTNTPPQTQGTGLPTRTPTHGPPGVSPQYTPAPGRDQDQVQVQMPRTLPTTPSHTSGFDMRLGIIIAVIVLVILLALLITLFLTHSNGALMPSPQQEYGILTHL